MLEHLDLNSLIAAYGYWVIFIGCLLEGETVLILGGMAAHQGTLQWLQVIGWATLGGILGDQLLFWTGRYGGARLLPKLKRHQAAIERVQGLIRRYPSTSVFAVRFLYGMRLVGPMVIGASGLAPWRFALLNVLGAAVWAILFVSAGYWAGEALQHFLGDLKPYRLPIFLGVIALVVLAALVRHLRNGHKAQQH
ncbi:membrane protein DedA, SNARE-associated domain [Pseudomonas sp. NFPP10]|uniref:DedA family protein n=1 Tax=unclassified Pseudomonas TaxID=196821 RepID=UPI00088EBFA9|nr:MULTISPECIES: DedA family protein [unclassified Pseudomonas]SDA19260.1 membrane protein DedA, SNARE-associated domain [Pseudomonas sp. NFPP12]SEL11233.1 membrane protein DedA, SNARE-associated domain [Pseudomonas sp. NFPP10]SFI70380.1 membrane protein DedA, SNARE-associated domain [Pseudomonas sp. NFPP08]SFM49652.1 membrane protein DedA, SNARE-associated domain [Pseudomonas sp. NFPP05]SFX37212.1 membrane protein DedA, SNARE-associated domain [Pseudomonas sp. NFPP09]